MDHPQFSNASQLETYIIELEREGRLTKKARDNLLDIVNYFVTHDWVDANLFNWFHRALSRYSNNTSTTSVTKKLTTKINMFPATNQAGVMALLNEAIGEQPRLPAASSSSASARAADQVRWPRLPITLSQSQPANDNYDAIQTACVHAGIANRREVLHWAQLFCAEAQGYSNLDTHKRKLFTEALGRLVQEIYEATGNGERIIEFLERESQELRKKHAYDPVTDSWKLRSLSHSDLRLAGRHSVYFPASRRLI